MTLETHTPESKKPEFSRLMSVADLTVAVMNIDIEATPDELAALTKRLGVDALEALNGRAQLQILPDGEVLMKMTFTARVKQHCVVTLEALNTDVSAVFTTTYSNDADEDWGHDEEEFEDLDADIEPPEPLVNGKFDIAEACVEQLALEIDPFPRVQGATFDGYSALPKGADVKAFEKKNPFAALSKLQTQKENDE